MRILTLLLSPAFVVVLLASGFGCKTPPAIKSPTAPAPPIVPLSTAPSAPAASPQFPVTLVTIQPPPTPSPTTTPTPSATLAPARFVLGDLTVTPVAVMAGENVTCSIPVSNTGGTAGTYIVVFKYKSSGGAIGSDIVEVTLKPGETRTATLTKTQKETGTFFINVNDKACQYVVNPVPTLIYAVPATSACAITSPPSSMSGINTHTDIFGTGSNPNMITLGPKLGSHPELPAYATHYGTTFELNIRGTPVLAPIDMVFVGFSNTSAEYRIQNGEKQTPYDDLMLFFESDSPDWPGMIIVAYHLYSSPLLLGHRQDPACSTCVEWGTSGQVKGHVFYPFDDYIIIDKGNAAPCDALIGYKVKRGELIGFAGSVRDTFFR